MAKNKQELEVGDLVRVGGHTLALPRRNVDWTRHGIASGTVCEVLRLGMVDGTVEVQGPTYSQLVSPGQLKLAKQAMRKRDEYAARR